MAKYKSIQVKKQEILQNGMIIPGITICVGVDDAGKASQLHADAIASGHYVPSNPNEVKEAKERLAAAELKENKRRGLID